MTAQIENRSRGGLSRGQLRYRRYQEEAQRAEEELISYKLDEPSAAFFTQSLAVEMHDVFDASAIEEVARRREGDLAKRRAVVINAMLQDPAEYPMTSGNLTLVERQWDRLLRFSKTLRNKGKLHPGIQKILKV